MTNRVALQPNQLKDPAWVRRTDDSAACTASGEVTCSWPGKVSVCLDLLGVVGAANYIALALRVKAFSDICHVTQSGSYIHTKQSINVAGVGSHLVAKIIAFTMLSSVIFSTSVETSHSSIHLNGKMNPCAAPGIFSQYSICILCHQPYGKT